MDTSNTLRGHGIPVSLWDEKYATIDALIKAAETGSGRPWRSSAYGSCLVCAVATFSSECKCAIPVSGDRDTGYTLMPFESEKEYRRPDDAPWNHSERCIARSRLPFRMHYFNQIKGVGFETHSTYTGFYCLSLTEFLCGNEGSKEACLLTLPSCTDSGGIPSTSGDPCTLRVVPMPWNEPVATDFGRHRVLRCIPSTDYAYGQARPTQSCLYKYQRDTCTWECVDRWQGQMWLYDADFESWIKSSCLPSDIPTWVLYHHKPRGVSFFALSDHLYVISVVDKILSCFSPDTKMWTQLPYPAILSRQTFGRGSYMIQKARTEHTVYLEIDHKLYSYTPGSVEEWQCEAGGRIIGMGVMVGRYLVDTHVQWTGKVSILDTVAGTWYSDPAVLDGLFGEREGVVCQTQPGVHDVFVGVKMRDGSYLNASGTRDYIAVVMVDPLAGECMLE
ncbi:hypothetical protein KIPB_010829 [Kipferlia bialata]|uniref:Uncharacterized protein n=1 Tax=Kipferlia bialata TaxID=797122 RepID=A0A9K3D3U0_9EUKA|nr:hypothetical protein KIPB_010829 [Kipferlia bialata]|eukprot:g10829.t1